VFTGVSIGISIFPSDSTNPEKLVQYADAALHAAKEAGRGCYRFYEPSLVTSAAGRLRLEAKLWRAMERREFVLDYQPLVDLQSGRVVGAEALLRWNDPVRGRVGPGEVIPKAEATGLIVPLGNWVLAEAVGQLRQWRGAGLDLGSVSVNVSPRQLQDPHITHSIADLLRDLDIAPSCLELEITESTLAHDDCAAKLRDLKSVGVKLSIDDFGTGYSSLSRLADLPIDKLKLDRSFIRDVAHSRKSQGVIEAVQSLCRALGIELLIEGIEDPRQRAYLSNLGCRYGQGFLLGTPMSPTALGELLARQGAVSAPAEEWEAQACLL